MNPATTFILLSVSAFMGCIFGWLGTKIVFKPARLAAFFASNNEKLAGIISVELAQHIKEPAFMQNFTGIDGIMEQMRPNIETQLDHFMKVKLEEHFPLLAKFMGEKTLGKLKIAFMDEVEELLPQLIKTHVPGLIDESKIKPFISQGLQHIPAERLSNLLVENPIRKKILFACTLAGLTIGIVNLLLWLVLKS